LTGSIIWDNDSTPKQLPGTLTGGSGSGGGGGGGSSVATLTLSGQVYTEEMNYEAIISGGNVYKYTPYTGNKTFTSNVGGTGSIRNGQLSFSVGTPPASSLEPAKIDVNTDEGPHDIYSNAKVVPSNTQGVTLDFSNIELGKENWSMIYNTSSGSVNMNVEMVEYIYVDRDCTITATGGTVNEGGVKYTYSNLNLNLKQGWNAVNIKMVTTNTTTTSSATGTFNFTTGDLSSCKWVIDLD
jgi:hypothetical protein